MPYSEQITEVVRNLAAAGGAVDEPALLAGREEIRKVAYVVITADRGLCGAYNSSVIRPPRGDAQERAAAGRLRAVRRRARRPRATSATAATASTAAFTGFTDQPTYEDARQIAAAVAERSRRRGRPRRARLHAFLSVGTRRSWSGR